MKHKRLTVNQKYDGKTLQEYLSIILKISRNRAKALIDEKSVYVERRAVWMARHVVIAGDVIEIPENFEANPSKLTKLYILYSDPNFVIIDKPAGILSNGPNSAESVLKEQIGNPTVMAIHRLDRDTTGCLMFALNKAAFDAMVGLFKQHQVSKRYNTIVLGRMQEQARRISAPIDGLPAETLLQKIDANENASHLKLSIDTGRTHQIRIHMASIRHPVLGDREHGIKEHFDNRTMDVPRQMLHASSITFTSPIDGKDIKVRAPLPNDFRQCLKAFGLK